MQDKGMGARDIVSEGRSEKGEGHNREGKRNGADSGLKKKE